MSSRRICTFPPLPPGTHLVAEGSVIVHVTDALQVTAAANVCQHAGARLGQPKGCVLTCGFHGWRLDASRMRYLEPHANVEQPLLIVDTSGADWIVESPVLPAPWAERQPRRQLIPRSFTARVEGEGIRVRLGAAEVSWPGDGPLLRWLGAGAGGRTMWIPGEGEPALLAELAGHRILVVRERLEAIPTELDLLVALGASAGDVARQTTYRAMLTDRASDLRQLCPGIPVWQMSEGLVLDVSTGRRV